MTRATPTAGTSHPASARPPRWSPRRGRSPAENRTRSSTIRSPSRWCGPSEWTSSPAARRRDRPVRRRRRGRHPADDQRDGGAHPVLRRLLHRAAAEGIRQAVILASGLDARAYRLQWPDGHRRLRDRSAQGDRVQERDDGVDRRKAHRRAPRGGIDLRDDWPAALRRNGFDDTQPTAWSAEGLLVYLPPDAQDRLFDDITALSAPGSRLATEYHPDVSIFSDERSQVISDRLKTYGHDIEMGDLIYHDERSDVIDYLDRPRLGCDGTVDAGGLRRQWF